MDIPHSFETRSFRHDGLDFIYLEAGPPDGEPIVMLHGFPQSAATWIPTGERLASRGYRVLALDQRGYSPGASPKCVLRYQLSILASDVAAFIREVAEGQSHLIGHDLGGEVAWTLANSNPEVLKSLTVVSTPHPSALTQAALSSDQLLRSWYIAVIQLPLVPELIFRANKGSLAIQILKRTGLDLPFRREYVDRVRATRRSLEGALSWYRAFPLEPWLVLRAQRIKVSTQFIWGTNDAVVTSRAANLTAKYVSGPYVFQKLPDISHWIPESEPSKLADLIDRFARSSSSNRLGGLTRSDARKYRSRQT